jgi:hypothetical protein
MIKVTKTLIKPDSEIALYSLPEDLLNLMILNQQEGKLQKVEIIKEDLQTKFIWKWDSIDSFNDYKNNTTYKTIKLELEAYNLSKGIIYIEEIEEIND